MRVTGSAAQRLTDATLMHPLTSRSSLRSILLSPPMLDRYPILSPESLLSPSLVVFREHLLRNIDAMIAWQAVPTGSGPTARRTRWLRWCGCCLIGESPVTRRHDCRS